MPIVIGEEIPFFRPCMLAAEVGEGLTTVVGDASEPAFANSILRDTMPDILVLAAGVTVKSGMFDEFDWQGFAM